MRVVILAHGDLDGLAAAATLMAALRRAKGARARLEITQPYNLYKALARLLAEPPDMLAIVDIGLDEASWQSTSSALRDIVERGRRVLWMDHHIHTIRHGLELAEIGVSLLYTSSGCASTLAREAFAHLTDDPAFYGKLTRLGEIADGAVKGEGEFALLADRLAAALSAPSSRDEFKLRLVKMWVEEHRLIDDEVALRAEEYEKALAEKMAEVEDRVVVEVRRGLLLDARDLRLSGFAGHIASRLARERGKVTALVFTPNEREVVATCRVPYNIDFNAVDELAPIAAELGGGGGGLEKAASMRVPRELGDEFLKKLADLFRRKLD
ncbi:MAG: hypothetical protein DRJ67_03605 [Thermoprotei archaeon]|nr:MAG: hypothetical protein DRJ67_03605 [Thermoprotei archaeon]